MLAEHLWLGFSGIPYIRIFNRLVERMVFSIDMHAATILSVVLVVSYVADFSYHFTKRLINKRMGEAVNAASKGSRIMNMFHK